MKERSKIITIPNLLSLVRLCLIPLLVWQYTVKQDGVLTAVILVLSGITDLVDGWIARRFNMISDLGKMLDPVADKLTQIAMMYCLLSRFPYMLFTLILLVFKEVFGAITSLLAIRRSGKVYGADWHGKVTTTLFYTMMTLHLLFPAMAPEASYFLVALCTVMMLISLILYAVRNFKMIRK